MRKHSIAFVLTLVVMSIVSCQNDGWDDNVNRNYTIGNDTITERTGSAVVSIATIKEKYRDVIEGKGSYNRNYVKLVEEDWQLQGWVACNDEGGNLSQNIIFTDGTDNIIISVADNDIHSYLQVGQKILVNLKGLYLGSYGKNAQIGYPNEKATGDEIRMSFMSRFMWYQHFKKIGVPEPDKVPQPVLLTSSADTWKDCSRLFYVEGRFKDGDVGYKIVEPTEVTTTNNCMTRDFTTDNGVSVKVYTSAYADFAAKRIPAGHVRLTGVASWSTYDGGYWQFQLRTWEDIQVIGD